MDIMTLHDKVTRTRATIEEGFALPVVVFCLVLMSVLGVAALATSGDEHRASRAMRQGSAAFYAAEAGLNEVYATWDSSRQAAVDTMLAGDSLDLGWRILANGHSYRALIHRWHNDGSQPMYEVITEGRGAGAGASQTTQSFMLTSASGPGEAYTLGECCEGAGVVRGTAVVSSSGTVVDGHDTVPAGWGGAGVCPDSLYDKPGITIKNAALLNHSGGVLTGEPPVVEDPTINDQTFSQFGPDLTWDEIKAMADFTMGSHGSSLELVNQIHPSYNGDGTCDTSDPYNWGSNDPANACFDHFPIILIRGNFSIEASYGQAVFILDTVAGRVIIAAPGG